MLNSTMYDVIAAGELNVDLILNKIDSFPELGKEKLADEMTLTLGSSTAIFASNLSALGAKTAFCGKIGRDDFADLIKKSLEKKGVAVDFLFEDDRHKTGITIVMNYNEDRAMVTYPGAMNYFSINDIKPGLLKQAKHLHFSSPFLQPGIRNDLKDLFQMAKQSGLTTSFDCQWDPDEKWDLDWAGILKNVDIFLPNEAEICAITKSADVQTAVDKIKHMVNGAAVKQGNQGSFFYQKNSIIRKKSFLNKNVVDAIGAGDSYDAGFIFQYIQDRSIEKCLEFGNLMGALNTTSAGGTGAFQNYYQIVDDAKKHFGYIEK